MLSDAGVGDIVLRITVRANLRVFWKLRYQKTGLPDTPGYMHEHAERERGSHSAIRSSHPICRLIIETWLPCGRGRFMGMQLRANGSQGRHLIATPIPFLLESQDERCTWKYYIDIGFPGSRILWQSLRNWQLGKLENTKLQDEQWVPHLFESCMLASSATTVASVHPSRQLSYSQCYARSLWRPIQCLRS